MSDIQPGKLLSPSDAMHRDAIHVAVLPVIAAEQLAPGDHVGLNNGEASKTVGTKLLGIVDPYLKQSVHVGEVFLLFLYPKSTVNLRHDWDHPSIPREASPQQEEDYEDECRSCWQ